MTKEIAPHPELTPARVQILVDFADNVAAGKLMLHWLYWIGGGASILLAACYYLSSIWRNTHILGVRP
jgi:hypothetical protein